MKNILIVPFNSHAWNQFITDEIESLLSLSFQNVNKVNVYQSDSVEDDFKNKKSQSTDALAVQSVSIYLGDHEIDGLVPDLILQPFETGDAMLYRDTAHCARMVYGSVMSDNELHLCADKLGVSLSVIKKMAWLSGVKVETVQGILLAGGKSSRMGTDKASLTLGETTLGASLAEMLEQSCDNLLVSIAKGKQSPIENIRVVVDKYDGLGPLAGICSSLTETDSRVSFVVACDIPYIHPMLIRKMLSFCNEYDIVVPSFKAGTVEPLMAVYTKKCLGAIETLLDMKMLRVKDLFNMCKTKTVAWSDSAWYANLNTREEYNAYCNANVIKTHIK
ncbi:MAG: molybdenum cofactor guanylyltransferase [Fibrobacter sp.]|nr:molybdenum cofactor guanylyltransferase [Fibrobacter sp.]